MARVEARRIKTNASHPSIAAAPHVSAPASGDCTPTDTATADSSVGPAGTGVSGTGCGGTAALATEPATPTSATGNRSFWQHGLPAAREDPVEKQFEKLTSPEILRLNVLSKLKQARTPSLSRQPPLHQKQNPPLLAPSRPPELTICTALSDDLRMHCMRQPSTHGGRSSNESRSVGAHTTAVPSALQSDMESDFDMDAVSAASEGSTCHDEVIGTQSSGHSQQDEPEYINGAEAPRPTKETKLRRHPRTYSQSTPATPTAKSSMSGRLLSLFDNFTFSKRKAEKCGKDGSSENCQSFDSYAGGQRHSQSVRCCRSVSRVRSTKAGPAPAAKPPAFSADDAAGAGTAKPSDGGTCNGGARAPNRRAISNSLFYRN
ncbi:hypothetical protein GQ54DRAFT_295022 [Martensiomyces pterosporus]|nr:hypothetical protein GQ54DRAFT_295022 [Martensiomyces pterosporus]